VLLRNRGFSLQSIGLAGLLSWPWTLKFVWGPIVDRYYVTRFGRRRSWIVPLQTTLALGLLVIGLSSLGSHLTAVIVMIGVMNLLASILDVATDGYATEVLLPEERGIGNTAQIGGFYLGTILGGGIFLTIEPTIGWRAAFALLAAFVLIGAAIGVMIRESSVSLPDPQKKPGWLRFLRRPGSIHLLALIMLLDFGDNFGTAMLNPFLVDSGLPQDQIGWISGTLGSAVAVTGAIIGGVLVRYGDRHKQLLLYATLQALSLVAFIFLARSGVVTRVSAGVVVSIQDLLENIFNVVLYSAIMDWTDPFQAATDFSILACAHNATFVIAAPLAGFSAQHLGHTAHFALGVVLSLGGVIAAKYVLTAMPKAPVSERQPIEVTA
jgi:MFS family permease